MRPQTARILAVGALGCARLPRCWRRRDGGDDLQGGGRQRRARVDYGFCVAELGTHRESPDADTWGLAKVAALTGIINAENAVYDANELLAKVFTSGPKHAALEQCSKLYDSMESTFGAAVNEIHRRRYGAGKEKAAEAAPLAHQCDDALARAGVVPSPLGKYSSYSVQIAIVCTAITNLIK